jgi:adenine phosphoribosyltransferase
MQPVRLRAAIRFVGGRGQADVWRLFDDANLLRDLTAALVDPFRGARHGGRTRARRRVRSDSEDRGLFPGSTAITEREPDYRGNRHELRLQRLAFLEAGDQVLLVDDWIETAARPQRQKSLGKPARPTFWASRSWVRELEVEGAAGLGALTG